MGNLQASGVRVPATGMSVAVNSDATFICLKLSFKPKKANKTINYDAQGKL